MSRHFEFALPDWLAGAEPDPQERYETPEDRMGLAVRLARQNVEHTLGGPFGAAVFDPAGRPVSVGVNLVLAEQCAVLHAEVVALVLAQRRLGRFDLSDGGREACSLASSTEPCMMCQGAVLWSGVRELLCGARDEDARAVGFEEGIKPGDWAARFRERGVEVTRDVLRRQAADVLREYVDRGGVIYNAH
jgi:tRNA(Arg) A34 adenosine deaminase TadA